MSTNELSDSAKGQEVESAIDTKAISFLFISFSKDILNSLIAQMQNQVTRRVIAESQQMTSTLEGFNFYNGVACRATST